MANYAQFGEGGIAHACAGVGPGMASISPSGSIVITTAVARLKSTGARNSGSVTNGSADLTVGHGAALGSDFSNASGVYILATPTDGPDTNENSGLWFLDLSSGSPAQGLQLPMLPAGWEYEGWVVIGGTPVSTGRFNTSAEVDLDTVFSGPLSGPPFPGEDFLFNAPDGLTFPVDLAGGTAVISVEPAPDDSTAPFTLKPLVGAIPEDARDHTVYPLQYKAGGFPSGTARILSDSMGK